MRSLLLIASLLCGCDAASNELPAVEDARSAAAEWAKINGLAEQGRLTQAYVTAMREEARQDLAKSLTTFSDPTSPQAKEVLALLALPDDAPEAQLHAHAAALKQVEKSLAVP
jgi:hypothetical protein